MSVELSAEIFKGVLTGLKSERPVGQKENRASPRVQLRTKLKIMLRAAGNQFNVAETQLQDLSSTGIGILHNTRLGIGDKFVIQLPSNTSTPLTLLCTVQNARSTRREMWVMGCTFNEVIPSTRPKPKAAPVNQKTAEATSDETDAEMAERIRRAMFD